MPFSTRTMTPADWADVKYFTPGEFKEPNKMSRDFVLWLDKVRTQAGVPMHITSSYRSPEHNAAIGGATDSAHCDVPCAAVDIGERPRPDDPSWNYSRWMIISTAILAGCKRLGVYADGSLHIDRTEDTRPAPRLWRVVR